MPIERRHSLIAALIIIPLLIAAALYYRAPMLVNPAGINSDSAVVGLQARHIAKGEWTPFMWGAGYQASFEPTIAALLFSFMGATPLALMWTPLSGFLVLLSLAFLILCRRFGWSRALILCLPLALCTPVINGTTVISPRQWCLTFVFLSLYLLDAASDARLPRVHLFLGAFAAFFGAYLDFFALLFFPALAVVGLLSSNHTAEFDPYSRRERRMSLLAGALAGIAFLLLIRLGSSGAGGTASFSLKVIPRNWNLFWSTCLPISLGSKVYMPGPNLYPDLWIGPLWFRILQVAGVLSFAACGILAVVHFFSSQIQSSARRLGLFGFIVIACTVVGFLGSKMVSDMHSARYLGPIFWVLPFAFAPIANRWSGKVLALLLVPYLTLTTATTWLSYGDAAKMGVPIAVSSGQGTQERELMHFLRQRGIGVAVAQYWLAYRLSFLFEENPIVTPQDRGMTRYAPYLAALDAAPVVAHIFHPSEPRYKPQDAEDALIAAETPYQKLEVAGFTVVIAYVKGSSLSE